MEIRKTLVKLYIFIKSLFGTKLEEVDASPSSDKSSSTWNKQQQKGFFDIYNVNAEDKIEYNNTYQDHHTNFKHLDDPEDERFNNVTEQVGLIYEEDGKTPKNAVDIFDMTYEQYEEYKEKLLPHAKERKITMEEIEALFD